jgi:hypothetical protein
VAATAIPVTNSVQEFGRIAPRATITKNIGRSRKCVNVGRWSRRAASSSPVTDPRSSATLVSRRSRTKYIRVIVLPSLNSKANSATMPASHGTATNAQPPYVVPISHTPEPSSSSAPGTTSPS